MLDSSSSQKQIYNDTNEAHMSVLHLHESFDIFFSHKKVTKKLYMLQDPQNLAQHLDVV